MCSGNPGQSNMGAMTMRPNYGGQQMPQQPNYGQPTEPRMMDTGGFNGRSGVPFLPPNRIGQQGPAQMSDPFGLAQSGMTFDGRMMAPTAGRMMDGGVNGRGGYQLPPDRMGMISGMSGPMRAPQGFAGQLAAGAQPDLEGLMKLFSARR